MTPSAGPATNLFGLDRTQLETLVLERGEPAYRAGQLYTWLYQKHARSIEAMTNLSKDLRQRLAAEFEVRWPDIVERRSGADGTVKTLFMVAGARFESVLIPDDGRRTICLSTQAGCALGCTFCLTGVGGFARNLDVWEILGQVVTLRAAAPAAPEPWNLVVMGMGEPLLNCDHTLGALRTLLDPQGFGFPPRRVTLSTVGILPGLERLGREVRRPRLAISLHAPNTELRRKLMPVEVKYPLEDVVAAARRYRGPGDGPVTYEYVLLRGVNDQERHARELARLLAREHCKVNLIPLNAAPALPFEPPAVASVEAFCRILAAARITVSVRRPRGQDIQAACGQLSMTREPRPAPVAATP